MSGRCRAVLREGGPADLEAVMGVMIDSFDPAYGEAWTARQCAGLLPMAGVWLSIATEDEEPVGFTLARLIAGEAELLLLAVRKNAQRRGVGALLLDRFIATAQNRDAQRLHLEVREGNHAVNLYKRAGFVEVGRRRGYYNGQDGQVYDALTLARAGRP